MLLDQAMKLTDVLLFFIRPDEGQHPGLHHVDGSASDVVPEECLLSVHGGQH